MAKINLSVVYLSLIGTLFSGFLVFKKLVSKTCALREGCLYLFNIPTCVYGFIMFLSILILSYLTYLKKKKLNNYILGVSAIGVLFSISYSVYELFFTPLNILNGMTYSLGLPSCVYGLFMFIAIFIISLKKK